MPAWRHVPVPRRRAPIAVAARALAVVVTVALFALFGLAAAWLAFVLQLHTRELLSGARGAGRVLEAVTVQRPDGTYTHRVPP